MRAYIAHDVRVEGRTPTTDSDGKEADWGQVGHTTPLSSFIWCLQESSRRNNGEIRLIIIAHGEASSAGRTKYPSGDGEKLPGGDIMFCKEHIKVSTVEQLQPLNGMVKGGVELHVCRACMITPGREGRDGDGNLLCSKMARIIGTTVKASSARQKYLDRGELGLKTCRWEGTVLTYGPKGDVIKVEHNPVFPSDVYVDPFGSLPPSCTVPKDA
jgi:hypothetical protein